MTAHPVNVSKSSNHPVQCDPTHITHFLLLKMFTALVLSNDTNPKMPKISAKKLISPKRSTSDIASVLVKSAAGLNVSLYPV